MFSITYIKCNFGRKTNTIGIEIDNENLQITNCFGLNVFLTSLL